MRSILFSFLIAVFFLVFASLSIKINSQERMAVCDLCGYCPSANPTPPSSWANCVRCLYPGLVADPSLKQTLIINPATNLPPTPHPGRQHTMFGCIETTSGLTTQEGVVGMGQFFLNIVFSVVGGLALIFLIYGAFVITTSQNNPEKLDYGKRVIYGAIIGVVFSLSSVFIVRLIAGGVLKIPGFGGF